MMTRKSKKYIIKKKFKKVNGYWNIEYFILNDVSRGI